MDIDSSYDSSEWGISQNIIQGVCPEGWHLPSDSEWWILINVVGGKFVAAKKLKSMIYLDGDDSYGFSALPAGARSYNGGTFYNIGISSSFWTVTEYNAFHSYAWFLDFGSDDAWILDNNKNNGFNVRCILD